MKSPENCDSTLRNRKKKENVEEKSEKSVKNSSKTSEKMETDDLKKVEQQQKEVLKIKLKSESKSPSEDSTTEQIAQSDSNFRIKLEFDPMSIALLMLAIITRFFKLSEPRNVV